MDTLAIIQKLKKKRPELAKDPLFSELEMAHADQHADPNDPSDPSVEGDDMAVGGTKGGGGGSYLDDEGPEGDMVASDDPEAGEAGADDMMGEMDKEEGKSSPADAMKEEEAEGASPLDYLDDEGEEGDIDAEPKPAKKKRPFPKMR